MTVLVDGATRTGRGFVAKQGARAPRRAPRKTPAKETTAQKKTRLRSAQSDPLGTLSNDANEEVAEAATPNTPGAAGNSLALNPAVGQDEYAEEDEDALFVGDGTPIESWDPTPTSNAAISHNLTAFVSDNPYNSTTGSVGTNNARPQQSLAALALANLVAQSTTHVDSAASTTAVTPVHHSTSSSRVSQAPQLMSASAREAWDYCHRPSDPWNSQQATYTDGPTEYLQGAPSRVSQTAQPIPSHTTDRSNNSTAGIWDYETMSFNSVPSNRQLGGEVSSGTSQQGVSFHAPEMSNTSSSIFGVNHSKHGRHGYGQHNDGECGYGQRDNGQHNYGQREHGQREHGQLQGGPENSLEFDLRNPLGGLVSGSGTGTYYGAYGSGFSTYGHENTPMTGLSEQPIPPPSGSHNHRDAFSGTAANAFPATSYTPAAGNAANEWQTHPSLAFGGTDENSTVLGATAEQTPAVFPTAPTNNATGAWGIGLPPFRNDNNQN